MKQIATGNLAKARGFCAARKKTAVHIGKVSAQRGSFALSRIFRFGIHRAEDFADDLVRVGGILRAHLLYRGGEQAVPLKMSVSSAKKQKINRAMK
jgi:hypothetical protein